MNNSNKSLSSKRILTILAIIFVGIIMYAFINNKVYNKVFSVFQPILIGIVIAYLINPLMMLLENLLQKLFKKLKNHARISRGISLTLSIIIYLGAISLILYLIVPQITSNIADFISTAPAKAESLSKLYDSMADRYDFVGVFNAFNQWMSEYFNNGVEISFETVFQWLKDGLFSVSSSLGSGIISFFGTTFNVAFNVIIGFIAAIYVLCSKEKIFAQIKKVMYAFFNYEKVNDSLETAREGNSIISRFIIGKLIDSAIIGILCFVVLLIFDIPYPVLVSVIIAITDVIPFFGPYIGAIPCTLLILLSDPIKALYFVIIIIVVQQVEGNVISPKIIGDTIGLSPFWVLFAMIVFGGMFGLIGMLLGVPIMALVFFILGKLSERRLRLKSLPTETTAYYGEHVIITDEEEATPNETENNEKTE